MYSAQITRGRTYKELAPCAVIFIQNFVELQGTAFHSKFEVLEVSTHELFSNALQVHIVELPKFDAGSIDGEAELARWVQFLSAKSDEEIEALAMSESVIGKAKEALDRLSGDPRVRDLAQQREFALELYSIDLGAAHKEGRVEGEAAALLIVLEARGFHLDAEQRQRIVQCTDSSQLHQWLRVAATLTDLNELFA